MLTPEEAEEKYVEKLYGFFKRSESTIDDILVDEYDKIRGGDDIQIRIHQLCGDSIPQRYVIYLVDIIREKYKEWDVEYRPNGNRIRC